MALSSLRTPLCVSSSTGWLHCQPYQCAVQPEAAVRQTLPSFRRSLVSCFSEKHRPPCATWHRRRQQTVQAAAGKDDQEWRPSFRAADEYGLYPWEQRDSTGEETDPGEDWVREPIITLLTAEGVVQLGGDRVPARRAQAWQRRQSGKLGRLRVFQEDAYMDPNQQLCLGATFDINATNGLDPGRRLYVLGFCRSVNMLNDVVEDMVLDQGGEVVQADLENPSGLHERLVMTLSVPMLWGIPPQLDSLRHAIRAGGGIVEKMYRQWIFQ